jgi:hypothetical protein
LNEILPLENMKIGYAPPNKFMPRIDQLKVLKAERINV